MVSIKYLKIEPLHNFNLIINISLFPANFRILDTNQVTTDIGPTRNGISVNKFTGCVAGNTEEENVN